MPQPLLSILLYLNHAAKQNQTGPVVCHWCNNRFNLIKYGKYKRYGFSGQELIDIQRYLCKHADRMRSDCLATTRRSCSARPPANLIKGG
jgi:transposase-like protein